MEPAVARAARDTAGAPGPDGRVEAVLPIEFVEHAAALLVGLGAEAEAPGLGAEAGAPAPTEARALPASAVAALAETYGGAARRPSGV
ncbi:hypothetical protein [Streptomyces sennicomposti]|uniref:hypothetical protein n=1 Tax=Streptomyces sennicomposti TaxID=2873384 RepID=UPI001CA75757|nr:hypothetical protein [Streptomyces sennicomposti]MBY8866154.1 hypothetical protein [Streptomyces sennicomposti]